jgi:hypothetical protein
MMKRMLTILAGTLFLSASVAAAQMSPAPAGDMMGKHTMDGHVTKVDAKKGWVDVKTPEGSMKLHFPPAALASVKKGDAVTVELGLKDNGPAASGKTMKDTSKDMPKDTAPATKK